MTTDSDTITEYANGAAGPAEPTPEVVPKQVVQELEDKVAALCADLAKKEQAVREAQDRSLRALADFENYKKRSQKEQTEQARFANERLIRELLPVLDNLERALSHSKTTQDFANMLEGVALVHKQQLSVLSKFGVRPIESLDAPFDPLIHQSIGQVELDATISDDADPRVVSEAQRGYFLHERVLRPSLVTIGVKKAPVASATQEETAIEGGVL
jgi:molecular chaperone GrpE